MLSICYSPVSLLRCDLLSTNESIGLVIPVILQAILVSAISAFLWARSRRQLFLVCEGWIDLLLSVLNLFWELYPAVRRNLHTFQSLDIVIGSVSFIPILFYSLFLCSLILTDLITVFPSSVRRVVRPFLFFFIPVLLGIQEAASFVGISYTLSPTHQATIIFQTSRANDLWTFFTSSALALFAGFQAIVSCLTVIKIIRALTQRRRLEYRYGNTPTKVHGLGWINVGILFGAIETIIGFAAIACFETYLARRIIRLCSRVLLCIGLFIGVDRDDSTDSVETPAITPFRQSRVKPLISNPRFSTFQRLPQTTTPFHPKPLASSMLVPSDHKSASIPRQQRVTILFDKGAPQLEVRLSHFELPYPPQPAVTVTGAESMRSYSSLPDFVPRPFTRPYGSHTDSISSSLSKVEIVTAPRTLFVPELAKATVMRTPSGRTVDRRLSSRPTSRPSSPNRVSSAPELLSVESGETKGKRVMSGERNEEFFEMVASAGVHSSADHPVGEVEEDMDNMFTVPSGDSFSSLAGSDVTMQEGDRPSMEVYYDTRSIRPSQEQFDPQQETTFVPTHRSGRHQFSLPPSVRSARRNERDNISSRASAPPRPPRNPSRSGNRQGSPDSSAPSAMLEEYGGSNPFRQREESPFGQEETDRRQTPVQTKAFTLAPHTPLTIEPISPAKTDSISAYSSDTHQRQSWDSEVSVDSGLVAIAL